MRNVLGGVVYLWRFGRRVLKVERVGLQLEEQPLLEGLEAPGILRLGNRHIITHDPVG
jgi:hypothetical protein